MNTIKGSVLKVAQAAIVLKTSDNAVEVIKDNTGLIKSIVKEDDYIFIQIRH